MNARGIADVELVAQVCVQHGDGGGRGHPGRGWTDFTTPTDALLSVLYAIAPHTLIDTPMMAEVFGIR